MLIETRCKCVRAVEEATKHATCECVCVLCSVHGAGRSDMQVDIINK